MSARRPFRHGESLVKRRLKRQIKRRVSRINVLNDACTMLIFDSPEDRDFFLEVGRSFGAVVGEYSPDNQSSDYWGLWAGWLRLDWSTVRELLDPWFEVL